MWGAMVYRAEVGPEPCPVDNLTLDILASKLKDLTKERTREKAVALSALMNEENGVKGGLDHFLSSLPIDNMLCDVSLLMGESKLARYRIRKNNVKISLEVAAVMRVKQLVLPKSAGDFWENFKISCQMLLQLFHWNRLQRHKRHAITTYALGRVQTVMQGCASGIVGFTFELLRSSLQFYTKSDVNARSHGALGCLFGLCLSPFYIIVYALHAVLILFDRVMVGIANGCFGENKLYIIDWTVQAHVYQTSSHQQALDAFTKPSAARQQMLFQASDLATVANQLFKDAEPHFPHDIWHYKVVEKDALLKVFQSAAKKRLDLTDEEFATTYNAIKSCPHEELSFSRFCLLLGLAVKHQFEEQLERIDEENDVEASVVVPDWQEGQNVVPIGVIDEDDEAESMMEKPTRLFSYVRRSSQADLDPSTTPVPFTRRMSQQPKVLNRRMSISRGNYKRSQSSNL